jgi:hypothetical protein
MLKTIRNNKYTMVFVYVDTNFDTSSYNLLNLHHVEPTRSDLKYRTHMKRVCNSILFDRH